MSAQTIKVHLPPDLRREIEAAANEELRSVSNTVHRIIAEWATRRRAQQSAQAAA